MHARLRLLTVLTLLAGTLAAAPVAAQFSQTTPPAAAQAAAPGTGQGSEPAMAQSKGGAPYDGTPPPTAEAADTLRRINAYRAAGAICGTRPFGPAAPLVWDTTLERAADLHSRDMARRRELTHYSEDNSGPGDRTRRLGYDWTKVAENASAGLADVPAALASWMNSPGHCANLMDPGVTEVGVAAAFAANDRFGWYRTMVLAKPDRRLTPEERISQAAPASPARVALDMVNALRSGAKTCNGATVPPVPLVQWDEALERAAAAHAGAELTMGNRIQDTGALLNQLGVRHQEHATYSNRIVGSQIPWLEDMVKSFCTTLRRDYTHLAMASAPDADGRAQRWTLLLIRAAR